MALPWSPRQYERHADHRLRPALDLLARVPDRPYPTLVDLGCGTGVMFAALRARFPDARLSGVDLAPSMLAKARERDPRVALVEADARAWQPDEPVGLLFSNAALQWVPDHLRILEQLAPQVDTFALQMPLSLDQPSHLLIREVIADDPEMRPALDATVRAMRVEAPGAYVGLLARLGFEPDVWETIYWQRLAGEDPVLEWTKGTALLPVLESLGGEAGPLGRRFLARYATRLREAYPRHADGTTLFPFLRLFVVGARRA